MASLRTRLLRHLVRHHPGEPCPCCGHKPPPPGPIEVDAVLLRATVRRIARHIVLPLDWFDWATDEELRAIADCVVLEQAAREQSWRALDELLREATP